MCVCGVGVCVCLGWCLCVAVWLCVCVLAALRLIALFWFFVLVIIVCLFRGHPSSQNILQKYFIGILKHSSGRRGRHNSMLIKNCCCKLKIVKAARERERGEKGKRGRERLTGRER